MKYQLLLGSTAQTWELVLYVSYLHYRFLRCQMNCGTFTRIRSSHSQTGERHGFKCREVDFPAPWRLSLRERDVVCLDSAGFLDFVFRLAEHEIMRSDQHILCVSRHRHVCYQCHCRNVYKCKGWSRWSVICGRSTSVCHEIRVKLVAVKSLLFLWRLSRSMLSNSPEKYVVILDIGVLVRCMCIVSGCDCNFGRM